jgi:hypothetical protein
MKPNRHKAIQPNRDEDQQFEERLRIAENIVRALLEAGYSCEIGDGPAPLKPLN